MVGFAGHGVHYTSDLMVSERPDVHTSEPSPKQGIVSSIIVTLDLNAERAINCNENRTCALLLLRLGLDRSLDILIGVEAVWMVLLQLIDHYILLGWNV